MKILLCNEAYIGDLILATSVLPTLKNLFPNCQIGFLVGSWAKMVVEDHEWVDWIHIHDQMCLNRNPISTREKREREKKTRKAAHEEIKKIHYDVAMDLHSFDSQNSGAFLFHTGIPIRVGGYGGRKSFFYTLRPVWNFRKYHVMENHRRMFLEMGVEEEKMLPFEPCFKYRTEVPKVADLPQKYLCIHMGTGEPLRLWPDSYWRELNAKLDTLGIPLLYTGKGKDEEKRIEETTFGLKNAYNFSNLLSWRQLHEVIAGAKLVVGVESMAGHLAAAYKRPGVFIYAGPTVMEWYPNYRECEVLMPKGGPEEIMPDEVFEKITSKL